MCVFAENNSEATAARITEILWQDQYGRDLKLIKFWDFGTINNTTHVKWKKAPDIQGWAPLDASILVNAALC